MVVGQVWREQKQVDRWALNRGTDHRPRRRHMCDADGFVLLEAPAAASVALVREFVGLHLHRRVRAALTWLRDCDGNTDHYGAGLRRALDQGSLTGSPTLNQMIMAKSLSWQSPLPLSGT